MQHKTNYVIITNENTVHESRIRNINKQHVERSMKGTGPSVH